MVQMANPLLTLFVAPVFFYAGFVVSVIGMLGVVFKKGPIKIYYDVFAAGSLFAWYAHWQPLFNDGSPVLFFFPLYFVFLATFIELGMLRQRHRVDEITFQQMQAFAKNSRVQPWIVMLGVLVSLNLDEHYMLYPVMMTILMMRFALFRYLEQRE